jgi:hypothetical protein
MPHRRNFYHQMPTLALKLLRTISPLLILGVCSCSRPLEGQVFVVTEGAGSYKLSLVPIFLIPKKEIEAAKTEMSGLLQAAKDAKRRELDSAKSEVEALRNAWNRASEKAELSRKREEAAVQKIKGFTGGEAIGFVGEPDERAVRAVDLYVRSIVNPSSVIVPVTSAISPALVRALNQSLQNNTSSPAAAQDALVSIARSFFTTHKELYDAYQKETAIASADRKSLSEARDAFTAADQAMENQQESMELSRSEIMGAFVQMLASFSPVTKTDANGAFVLKDAKSTSYLFAFAERAVGTDKEQYCWMINLDDPAAVAQDSQLMLSNDNMMSPEDLLKL